MREWSLSKQYVIKHGSDSPDVDFLTKIYILFKDNDDYLYYSLLLTSGEVKAAAPVLVCIRYFINESSSLKRLETLKSINLTSNVPF